jgi:threonyl-tRNA synthetase
MDTKANGQAAGSYEDRNDLAIRSAAGDPMAEPRSNPPPQSPKSPKSSHLKKPSVSAPKPEKPQKNESSKQPSANQAMSGVLPDFILRRNELFDKLKRQRQAEILEKEKPEIDVVLDLALDKEGKPRPAMPVAAKAWESTPGSFLRHVDNDVKNDVVIAKIDGKELWDLDRPLEYGCRVSYIPFSSAEGRNVFWHSSAHVLGEAAECQFNCLLSHGPPVEQGFFYDMAIAEG